jgi:Leucine-rich repeat (LRR) protein
MATPNNYYNNNDYNNNNNLNNNGMHDGYPRANWNNRKIMDFANQGLTTLPPIPDDTIELYCNGNLLTSLPELPQSLRVLNCSNNQLTSLPTLPSNLRFLAFENNQVTSFPRTSYTPPGYFPNYLRVLICGNNQLKSLPEEGAENLQILTCENNQITNIPTLDDNNIEQVNFDNNPLSPPYEMIYQEYKASPGPDALEDFAEATQELDMVKSAKKLMLRKKFKTNLKTNRNKLKELYKYKRIFTRKPGVQNNSFLPENVQNLLASYATGIKGKTMEQQQNILAKRIPQVQRYGVSINPKIHALPFYKNKTRLRKLLEEEKKYNKIGQNFEAKQGGRKTRKRRH